VRPLSELHAIVPAGIDDLALPSGGNSYDRRLLDGLAESGWAVVEHAVPGPWPGPDARALTALAVVAAGVPEGGLLLVDGLVASCAASVLVPAAVGTRLVVLVHLPLGVADPAAAELERHVLGAAAAVVTTSGWTRDWLLAAYALAPAAVHVARPGVEPAPVAPAAPGGRRLLCVGAVSTHKGHADLVEALGLVAHRPWTCVLAGALTREPDVVLSLRHRLSEAGLTDRVHLVGALGPADLARAYAASDLLVLPSHLETYGMVVTEALARGIPVVATAVGGVSEALGHAPGGPPGDADGGPPGLLVPARDPVALAGALSAWLEDAGLRERLRRRALCRRTTLSPWSRTSEEVSAVLTGVRAG
jgi:glycosyltransferase involved in cell wall biosynthesis